MNTPVLRPHVVIIGGGFAGLATARALAHDDVEITLIDRQNHHVFQPLLYEVATAGFSSTTIAEPLRSILAQQRNVTVLMDEVLTISTNDHTVLCAGGTLHYDYLVVAAGAGQSYFGHDEWAPHARPLKTVDDALELRTRLLTVFETAEREHWSVAPTFVVVGGGPTGVELAGHIAELARQTLRNDFRRVTPTTARVVLVEAAERILSAMSAAASRRARVQLERLGVEVVTSVGVTDIDTQQVRLSNGTSIAAHFVTWAAGVAASPLGRALGAAVDRGGRVIVQPDLSVPGHPEIFVIGDLAACRQLEGRLVPGVAPAAKQMGRYVGTVIVARRNGTPAPGPFTYRDYGSLATIGRNAAVADLGPIALSGRTAWLFWLFVHILFLRGARLRIAATATWLWRLTVGSRAARLIIAPSPRTQTMARPTPIIDSVEDNA
ncbi:MULTISPECIES: NAD(P)/FAD-dependent oxidoreductase [unclassified Burkholderia]|uniref:NAD(P)/FAD-dependent oxidoreductase n=1 Tax=unclassified Burkholderia TaxID=2613784 RepID=UPI000F576108|nr:MULTISPECIES: NAD(P)/FAD-dependent oxidoreductase [unclassified Burkholderia]RQR69832.1 NAD(P)/FAD-dependent oxidoreductase [Burkholderia sp. Bp9012]RQR73325.1 NAD(P)/FAD-dependent oxidoreductase [Burkholderia sp. Bp9011]RQR85184.1 NAD(P)/FAD-dependent oxidoreductase [Burkholderia sp. Bp9010]RQZ40308.1 NAD(P)/FAD-dependent oxidoreductase [Burkholderia sp. Bp9099]